MSSQAFDQIYRKIHRTQGPIYALATMLSAEDGFDFKSTVDLMRFARELYAAGAVFQSRLDECGRRSLDATNFRRKLQGKQPVRPENQPLLILLIKLKDLAPW